MNLRSLPSPVSKAGLAGLAVSVLLQFAACGSDASSHLAGGGVITDNTLSIRVTTPDGLPAARAVVSCRDFEITAQGEALGQPRTASADDSGRVTISCVARRGTAVEATSPDGVSRAFAALPPDADSAELHLDPVVALEGRFEHLAGAWIGVPGLGRGTRIDESGHFLLEGVPTGLRELAIVAGTQAAYLDLRLHPHVTDRIRLPAVAPDAARPDPRWGAGVEEVRLATLPVLDTTERSGIEILDGPGGRPLQTGLPADWTLVEDFGLYLPRLMSLNGATYYLLTDSLGGDSLGSPEWRHVDRGVGTAKLFVMVPGRGATWGRMGFSLGRGEARHTFHPRDLTGLRAIRFKARGNGSWTLEVLPGGHSIVSSATAPHENRLALTTEWVDYRIPVDSLLRRGDGAPLAASLSAIQAIQFRVDLSQDPGSGDSLLIDDIILEGVAPAQLLR